MILAFWFLKNMMSIYLENWEMYLYGLNTIKCRLIWQKKDIVFHRPNARNVLFSSEFPGTERVLCAKLLSVWLQAHMGMRKHVVYILHICNQRTYFLTQLKRQGLPQTQLQYVLILARVLSASPAWLGYLSAANIDSLQELFIKAKRWQIVTDKYDVSQLFDKGEMALFKSS